MIQKLRNHSDFELLVKKHSAPKYSPYKTLSRYELTYSFLNSLRHVQYDCTNMIMQY
jgi:hypothetical protein